MEIYSERESLCWFWTANAWRGSPHPRVTSNHLHVGLLVETELLSGSQVTEHTPLRVPEDILLPWLRRDSPGHPWRMEEQVSNISTSLSSEALDLGQHVGQLYPPCLVRCEAHPVWTSEVLGLKDLGLSPLDCLIPVNASIHCRAQQSVCSPSHLVTNIDWEVLLRFRQRRHRAMDCRDTFYSQLAPVAVPLPSCPMCHAAVVALSHCTHTRDCL